VKRNFEGQAERRRTDAQSEDAKGRYEKGIAGMRRARRGVEDSSFSRGTGARLYFGDAGRRTFSPIS